MSAFGEQTRRVEAHKVELGNQVAYNANMSATRANGATPHIKSLRESLSIVKGTANNAESPCLDKGKGKEVQFSKLLSPAGADETSTTMV